MRGGGASGHTDGGDVGGLWRTTMGLPGKENAPCMRPHSPHSRLGRPAFSNNSDELCVIGATNYDWARAATLSVKHADEENMSGLCTCANEEAGFGKHSAGRFGPDFI